MARELCVKRYRCPDCGTTKSPTHQRRGCGGVVAYNYADDRWECTKCNERINSDTRCTNCDRKVNGFVQVVRTLVR
jgi:DNA-directed RNA polymerase subunit RPC12/RpoP